MSYLRKARKDQTANRFSADHNYRTFDMPVVHTQVCASNSFSGRDFERRHFPADTLHSNRHPSEERISSILGAIARKHFSYYVKGGFIRSRKAFMTPLQVARLHGLPVNECLFEIKDPRIEAAVLEYGLNVVSHSSHLYRGNQ